jgi:hypothetical protein
MYSSFVFFACMKSVGQLKRAKTGFSKILSCTYVDFAKQVTLEDSALPYDYIPSYHEAETFL